MGRVTTYGLLLYETISRRATAQPGNRAIVQAILFQKINLLPSLPDFTQRFFGLIQPLPGGQSMTAQVPSAIPWLHSTAEGVHPTAKGRHPAIAWLHAPIACWVHSVIARGQSNIVRRLLTAKRRQSALIHAIFDKNRSFCTKPRTTRKRRL